MREVGNLGESIFNYWCSQTDMICNSSKGNDKTGWDYLIEFPLQSKNSGEDLHKSGLECKIQVKSTDTKKKSWAVKLSNLKRLCNSDLPVFFVLIHCDKKNTASRVFIRHVDNKLVTEVLNKIHSLEQHESSLELHKHYHSVKFENTDELTVINGQNLKERILNDIGEDLSEYIKQKETHRSRTGREDGDASIFFSTTDDIELENLVNALLGKNTPVNVKGLTITRKRFGLLEKKPTKELENATLSINGISSKKPVKIKFRKDAYSPALTFDANLFTNPLYSNLPDNLKKYRIESKLFEIDFYHEQKKCDYTFNFDESEKIETNELLKLLQFYDSISTEANSKLEIVLPNGKSLNYGLSKVEKDIDYSNQIQTLKNLKWLLSHFDISDNIKLSLLEVYQLEKKSSQLKMLIQEKCKTLIKLQHIPPNYKANEPHVHIHPIMLKIDSFFLVYIASYKGVGKMDGLSLSITSSDINFEKNMIFDLSEKQEINAIVKSINDTVAHIGRKYEDTYFTSIETLPLEED